MENNQAKLFVCSCGGEIQTRIHDNQLSYVYVGGDNKILFVNSSIKFHALLAELSALFDGAGDVCLKYQFPGEDLDLLMTVSNEKDVQNMMRVYDLLENTSTTSTRMRLFLFPKDPPPPSLTSGPASAQPDLVNPSSNVDFFLGPDNGAVVPPPPATVDLHNSVPEPVGRPRPKPMAPPQLECHRRVPVNTSDRFMHSDLNVSHSLVVRSQWHLVVNHASSSSASHLYGPLTRASSVLREVDAPTENESTFHTSWGTSKAVCPMASSSSSSSSSQFSPLTAGKSIFINYRGEDTGPIFVCHLRKALTEENFEVFDDKEIVRGDEILTSLFRAIEEAYASVVVFSKTYAWSKWCLTELVKIMKCRKERGLIVLPVFHNIDTSHVRNQLGSFEEAFQTHSQNFKIEEVQKWSGALFEAANLAGYDSRSRRCCRDDSDLIQNIVKYLLQKCNHQHPSNDCKSLVGNYNNSGPLELLQREAQSVGISADETTKMIHPPTISS